MIQGVDVWHGYGTIDWKRARAEGGVRFCWAKCTQGNDPERDDRSFARHVAGCKEAGVYVGAYHYCYALPDDPEHPGRSPEEEIDRFFARSGGLGRGRGELPPMLDAEHPAPERASEFGCTRPQMSAWLRRAAERVVALWGRRPVIYTYPAWWRWLAQGANVSWAREYELVFADYGWPGPGTPPDGWQAPHIGWVKGTWADFTVCQYSADGSPARIPGIPACPIDRDCIRDEATLLRLANMSEPLRPEQLLPEPQTVTSLTESLEVLRPTDRELE